MQQVSAPSLVRELDLVNKAWPPSQSPTPMVIFKCYAVLLPFHLILVILYTGCPNFFEFHHVNMHYVCAFIIGTTVCFVECG